MIILQTFLTTIAQMLHIIITAYIFIIIATALVTWVNPDPYNKIVQFLYKASAPAYNLLRKTKIPTTIGVIDLSPIIIIFVLQFIDIFLVRLLHEIAFSL